jgi:hypothetical protein
MNLIAPITITIADRPAMPNHPAPEPREVTINSLTLRQAIDDPIAKKVTVLFYETRFPVTIWEGESYDEAGNWTQEQLEAAISAAVAADAVNVVTEGMAFPTQPSEAERKAQGERMRAAFPNGFPRPAWIPAPQAPAPAK